MSRVGAFWRARTPTHRGVVAIAVLAAIFSALFLFFLSGGETYDYENYTDQACQYAYGYDTPGEGEDDAGNPAKVEARARLDQPANAELRAYCVALGANQLAFQSTKYGWLAANLAVLAVALGVLAALLAVLQWESSDEGSGGP